MTVYFARILADDRAPLNCIDSNKIETNLPIFFDLSWPHCSPSDFGFEDLVSILILFMKRVNLDHFLSAVVELHHLLAWVNLFIAED